MIFSIGYLFTLFECNYLCVYFYPSELNFVCFDFVKYVSAFLLSATGVPRHSCNDFLLLLCSQAHYATDQWDYSLAALKIT